MHRNKIRRGSTVPSFFTKKTKKMAGSVKIDKTESKINIYSWWTSVNILELKIWVSTQIEQGKTEVSCNVDWGYYADIDAIFLEAK